MLQVLLAIEIMVALALVAVILLQRSEGGALGIGGGGGGMMSARGAANLLTRATAVLATLFIIISLALANLAGRRDDATSVFDQPGSSQVVPATDDPSLSDLPPLPTEDEGDDIPVPSDEGGGGESPDQ